MPSNVVDIPLNGKTKEELNIKAYQEALIDFINDAEAPLTIALQGEWGSGKTSLMNYLKDKLASNYHVIEINTWQYSMLCTPD